MPKRVQLSDGETLWEAEIDGRTVLLRGAGLSFTVDEPANARVRVRGATGERVGVAATSGDAVWVGIAGETWEFHLVRGKAGGSASRDADALSPPMSATVVRIAVKPGDRVASGDLLVALEAMKMELPIRAPRDGVITAIHCAEGDMVRPGMVLLEIA